MNGENKMKVIIFLLALLLAMSIEMIILLYRSYKKLVRETISKDEVLKLIEKFKVVSNQKLSKEDFERNDTLRLIQDEIRGVTLENSCGIEKENDE